MNKNLFDKCPVCKAQLSPSSNNEIAATLYCEGQCGANTYFMVNFSLNNCSQYSIKTKFLGKDDRLVAFPLQNNAYLYQAKLSFDNFDFALPENDLTEYFQKLVKRLEKLAILT